ncbi:GIY-YIG nuclease family protein [Stenotrophomonas sp. 24(2023)]|uniref:GIY-YIG nuclease family protein n=1 Tax=Stenotrophomonas sp. 24(2023) TaxID=3068324 RepID=UPI0027E0704B|nr:GIY-YIG nuclease family protein [Stenotrophomonas sp. 24(2023)]WMJ67658.1 GIY-YIG nuclease family protein [Stenotrophomonas sp. 24(2023)]
MINPHLSWSQPHSLRLSADKRSYEVDLNQIPTKPGVYVFYRNHGSTFKALYVGKADNLRNRIKQQLNNHRLMVGIQEAPNGARLLCFGELQLRPGQDSAKAQLAAEKLMIRHFIEEGHVLFNQQGVQRRVQTLINVRPPALKKLIPLSTQIEA